MVADVDVNDDGYVTVHVAQPLTVNEAHDVARAILEAAAEGERYLAEQNAAAAVAPTPTVAVVHGAPMPGYTATTCCGRDPFKLPAPDTITGDESAVTCGKAS
ncbi:hypothetical protein GCM10017586_03340 [Microbacterium imperiale]|uniref:Uncharacterized protein n=2 Tax=Microbacterium imperiale TaxID=33884 RepID=A0A9W6HE52_9MICO|nr:hypothetical protein GCM10017544_13280 [Microbacterium imperiale]GLJ78652.1 hypothetical protein GCM10017586_03340 [Microbacterium imperiale]